MDQHERTNAADADEMLGLGVEAQDEKGGRVAVRVNRAQGWPVHEILRADGWGPTIAQHLIGSKSEVLETRVRLDEHGQRILEVRVRGTTDWEPIYAPAAVAYPHQDYHEQGGYQEMVITNLPGWQALPFDGIVDASGAGDYLTLEDAVADGCVRILIRAGTYNLTADVELLVGSLVVCEDIASTIINVGAFTISNAGEATWVFGTIQGGTDATNGAVKAAAAGPFEFVRTRFYSNARHIGGAAAGSDFACTFCRLETAGAGDVGSLAGDRVAFVGCLITNGVSRSLTLSGADCVVVGNRTSNLTLSVPGTGTVARANTGLDERLPSDRKMFLDGPTGKAYIFHESSSGHVKLVVNDVLEGEWGA